MRQGLIVTPYDFGLRFVGLREIAGPQDHPFIVWSHSLCGLGIATPDEVPWCSSWLNAICWMLRLPRSMSAAARSWLDVGRPIGLEDATPGFDVVIFQRGTGTQPGAEVRYADGTWPLGHVGLYAGRESDHVLTLGGNQSDSVNISRYPVARLLGVRRLALVEEFA